jgi:hypothetical protein
MNGVPPPVDKLDKDEKHSVLMKFTKANLKLNIPLEIVQIVSLLDFFIDSTLTQIEVKFKDWRGLRTMIADFSVSDTRHTSSNTPFDISKFVEVKMRHQNTFACFLFFLERKYQ